MASAARVRDWLRREETVVVFAAIAVAVPAAYLARFALEVAYEASFLLLMAVGVGVPTASERWPHRRGRPRAIAWTLVTSIAVVAVFVLAYEVLSGPLDGFVASVASFLLVHLGLFGIVWLLDGR